MNIIELAKEAGIPEVRIEISNKQLERFAALVRAERELVDLTDAEIGQWVDALPYDPQDLHLTRFARAVIAAFKEKNE